MDNLPTPSLTRKGSSPFTNLVGTMEEIKVRKARGVAIRSRLRWQKVGNKFSA